MHQFKLSELPFLNAAELLHQYRLTIPEEECLRVSAVK